MGGGYDAVRVVMFVAMDYQQNPTSPQAVQAKQILQTIVGYYSNQTLSSSSFSIPSPSTGQAMTEDSAPDYAKILFNTAATPVTPAATLQYRDTNGNLIFNPGNPTAAACLLIAAHALGEEYASLENTCYDYLMTNLPADVGGGGGTDGGVQNIPYFAGMLTAVSAQVLGGNFPTALVRV